MESCDIYLAEVLQIIRYRPMASLPEIQNVKFLTKMIIAGSIKVELKIAKANLHGLAVEIKQHGP